MKSKKPVFEYIEITSANIEAALKKPGNGQMTVSQLFKGQQQLLKPLGAARRQAKLISVARPGWEHVLTDSAEAQSQKFSDAMRSLEARFVVGFAVQ